MNALKKFLITLVCIAMAVLAILYDSLYKAPQRFRIRTETLSSLFIPKAMDGKTILYFSDLHYGKYMNANRLYHLMDVIHSLSPDIILFGGDIFDEDHAPISQDDITTIAANFGSMKAPLGKFAVYGDVDHENDETNQTVNNILYSSDFEVLNNASILIHNGTPESITLVGLDSMVNGTPDIAGAYSNVSRATYVITMCHTPDLCEQVPEDLTSYFLAGHSMGGQAYWGVGSLYEPKGAEHYFRGMHTINNAFTLDITSGVGTTKDDVRFLSSNEVVYYTLKHLDVNEEK